jgi:hypothetical protein
MSTSSRAAFLALALALAPSSAFANAWVLEPGDWYTEVNGSWSKSDTYLNNFGERVPLPLGGIVERRTATSYSEFGWRPNMAVLLAIPYTSVSVRSADESFRSTETGLGNLGLGAKYALLKGETAVSVQADAILAMGYNRRFYPDTLATLPPGSPSSLVFQQPSSLGAGSQSFAGRVLAGRTFQAWNAFIEGAAGYEITFGRADVVADSAGRQVLRNEAGTLGSWVLGGSAGLWLGKSLLLAGRYVGRVNNETIPDASVGIDDDMASSNLVGPLVLYRVDDNLDLMAGSMHTAGGKRTMHLDRFYVALSVKHSGLTRLQGFLGSTKE